jgi:hypothetical protein
MNHSVAHHTQHMFCDTIQPLLSMLQRSNRSQTSAWRPTQFHWTILSRSWRPFLLHPPKARREGVNNRPFPDKRRGEYPKPAVPRRVFHKPDNGNLLATLNRSASILAQQYQGDCLDSYRGWKRYHEPRTRAAKDFVREDSQPQVYSGDSLHQTISQILMVASPQNCRITHPHRVERTRPPIRPHRQ